VFAVGGVAFPIGVLCYWTTTNLWTMGQQFYVIRNNPAPNTEAFRAKERRDAEKAKRRGEDPAATTGTVEVEDAPPPSAAKRAQPKRVPRSQRKSGGNPAQKNVVQKPAQKPAQRKPAQKNPGPAQNRSPKQGSKAKPKPTTDQGESA
jgi:YidC/Oxa1 family membrane protein insertase